MTTGRAALVGAGEGLAHRRADRAPVRSLLQGPGFGELLLYSLVVGALSAGSTGAIIQAIAGEGRNFASTMTVATDRYEVQVDEDAAAEATRILEALPRANGARS